MAKVLTDAPKLAEFLEREPVAVLAVPIDEQGTIHTATIGYWNSISPLEFFFATSVKSEKCRLLKEKKAVQAACVVGTYRGTDFTLQMRGTLRILDQAEHQQEIDRFCAKRGKRPKDLLGPDSVFIGFIPDWARYTDYSQGWSHHFLTLNKDKNEQ